MSGDITLLPYRERVKLVQQRVAHLRWPSVPDLPKNARVLAAEKVLAEYQKRNQEHEDKVRLGRRQKLNAITDALIVGDMKTAVLLLQKLEA